MVNIFFDYEGHYSQIGYDYHWHPREANLYGVSFGRSSIEEITYFMLVDRICRKIGIDESLTKLKLSFIPSVVPQTQSSINDDEDVFMYLTSMDNEGRRSVLHVEVIRELEIVPVREEISRVVGKSSFGVNYCEPISKGRDNDGVDVGAVTLYVGKEPTENVCIGDVDKSVEKDVDKGVEKDVDNCVENNLDHHVENDVDMSVESSSIREYVDLPRGGEQPKFLKPWEDGLGFELEQEFESKVVVQDLVVRASNLNCFGVNILNSDKKRYVVKYRESEKGCQWYLRAAKLKNSNRFSVRVYTKMHSCSQITSSTGSKMKGTPRLVASLLHEDYPGQFQTPPPKSLICLVQGKLGVQVSYSTAYRGKRLAVSDVRGSPKESFKMIYSYMHMLENVNPGTKTSVVLDDDKRFKYLFVAFGAAIEGFQAMRKVIILDATFLKTVDGGCLVFATAQDPNHHHYPLAFDVVDGEKDESWTWFLTTLQTVIPDSPDLIFISDRNKSLIKAVGEVYPSSHHGYCIYHLSQNVRVKGPIHHKDVVASRFRELAQMYTVGEFEKEYEDYRKRYPVVADYLDETCEVEKWARCYFRGIKYNIDTSNAVESMNSVFSNTRKYALLPMVDAILAKFAEWFMKNKKESVGGSDAQILVLFVENEVHDSCAVAYKLTVNELNAFELVYSVTRRNGKTYVVDLRNKSCSCRRFDLDKYPCVHAIAATMKYLKEDRSPGVKDLYALCTKYYFVEQWALAYVRTIYHMPHQLEWKISSEIEELYALLPNYFIRKGRIQESRKPSVGERRNKNKRVRGRNLG